MKKILKLIFSPFLGRKQFRGLFSALFLLSLKGMNFGGGANPKDSGEDNVIKYALGKLKFKKISVFDVGGNYGEYTKLWLKILKQYNQVGEFSIFEPSTHALEHLRKEFSDYKNVRIFPVALSNQEGEAVLYSNFAGSGLGSLAKRDLSHAGVSMENEDKVKTSTLDKICEQENIPAIDFLKIDVEGFELAVLQGAVRLLAGNNVKFIQFEFGGTDIDTRIFFKDFYLLLSPKYKIYRILKNGLAPIEKYSEFDEIFLTTNYFAELK
jgi:FkbM family methyltransferase